MAADFFQSNLFNPTAPSERTLKEAKLRIIRMTTMGACEPSSKGSDQRIPVDESLTEDSPQSQGNKSVLSNSSRSPQSQENKTVLSISPRYGIFSSTVKESSTNGDDVSEETPHEKGDSHGCDESAEAATEGCSESVELYNNRTDLPQVHKNLLQTDVTGDKSANCRDGHLDVILRTDCNSSAIFMSQKDDLKEEENNNCGILSECSTLKTNNSHLSSLKEEMEPSKGDKAQEIEEDPEHGNNQKQILQIVRFLFAVKWIGQSNKEDQIHLVGNEMADTALENQDEDRELKNNSKRRNKRKPKHTSAKRKLAKLWTKWMQGRMKNDVADGIPSTKKKKSKKQNMGQVGRQLKSRLGYGCRYIGHGLANMTSIIPEASHVDPIGNIVSYNDFECVKNDYYDPNAPAWDFNKGYYVRRTRVF